LPYQEPTRLSDDLHRYHGDDEEEEDDDDDELEEINEERRRNSANRDEFIKVNTTTVYVKILLVTKEECSKTCVFCLSQIATMEEKIDLTEVIIPVLIHQEEAILFQILMV